MKRESTNAKYRFYRLINNLCDISHGTNEFIGSSKITRMLLQQDTSAIFSWLLRTFSYQGLSDRAVESFISKNANTSFEDVRNSLGVNSCNKLNGFWTFEGCAYQKLQQSCSHTTLLRKCGVPKLPLRNGRLNQLAFSLFFFIRDVAQGELVEFLNSGVSAISENATPRHVHEQLIPPWKAIYGVSDKVATMALSTLLLGSPSNWHGWHAAGGSLIVVDSLVHNFLHRTGIIQAFGTKHTYGAGCYAAGGCFDAIGELAKFVDARRFNIDFPSYFPRFVQLAIWRYCAQSGWNICNGNKIDDRTRCVVRACSLRNDCWRKTL